jgi:hypothetical protein
MADSQKINVLLRLTGPVGVKCICTSKDLIGKVFCDWWKLKVSESDSSLLMVVVPNAVKSCGNIVEIITSLYKKLKSVQLLKQVGDRNMNQFDFINHSLFP